MNNVTIPAVDIKSRSTVYDIINKQNYNRDNGIKTETAFIGQYEDDDPCLYLITDLSIIDSSNPCISWSIEDESEEELTIHRYVDLNIFIVGDRDNE